MIESAKISFFESHRNTVLEFHEGVNVIIGQSDQGKSGILRALNWALNNLPGGDGFISDFAEGPTEVVVNFPEGGIYRGRDGTSNEYRILGTDGKEVQDFKAFKREVPEDVAALIRMGDINWQRQFDSHFLLSETAGEVARQLNKIVRLDSIDRAHLGISRKERETKQALEFHKEHAEGIRESLKAYDHLSKMEEIVLEAEELEEQHLRLIDSRVVLNRILGYIEESQQSIQETRDLLQMQEVVDEILNLETLLEVVQVEERSLLKLGKAIRKNKNVIKESDQWIELAPDVDELEDLCNQTFRLENIVEQMEKCERYLKSSDEEISKLQSELPEMCPTCGQPIEKDH